MTHLVRAGGVLLAVLAVVFVVPRLIPVTESLGNYGFYPRSDAENAREWASLPVKYVASSVCSTCHKDKTTIWQEAKHKTVNCEDCHGPAKAHVDRRAAVVKDTSRDACAVCHAEVVGRPVNFPQVDPAAHGGQSTCVTCHSPHTPVVARTLPVIPHAAEGRGNCLVCHNTTGIKPFPATSHTGRDAATCQDCHKSK